MNIDREWNFIVAETHREKPNNINKLKREVLFVLQILLSKIQATTSEQESNYLSKNYFVLKFHLQESKTN